MQKQASYRHTLPQFTTAQSNLEQLATLQSTLEGVSSKNGEKDGSRQYPAGGHLGAFSPLPGHNLQYLPGKPQL